MRLTTTILTVGAILTGAVLTGCRSKAYYRAQAVEEAREYAMPKVRDLTEIQRDYIRYAPPQVMEEKIFYGKSSGSGKFDRIQTCIAWKVPDMDEYLVVFGWSAPNMVDWSPYQVIRKKYIIPNTSWNLALKNAVNYSMQNMLYLNNATRNRIRFVPPEVCETKLDMKGVKAKINNAEKAKNTEISKDSVQISMLWEGPRPDELVVVTGYAKDMNLAGFQIVHAGVKKSSEVRPHVVKEIESTYKSGINPEKLDEVHIPASFRTRQKNLQDQKKQLKARRSFQYRPIQY